jgi:phospholipase C
MLQRKSNPPWPGRVFASLATACMIICSNLTVAAAKDRDDQPTVTPIKHVVVLFQENVSFDHYFATYPFAQNPAGEPRFVPSPDTPSVNGLSHPLIVGNQNSTAPFRLDRSRAATCDQDHDYKDEQMGYHAGLLDKFVEFLGNGPGTDGGVLCNKADVMGYYDGNTVTALWNYAQRFSMSDNHFDSTFGPSTPGHLNLIAGQTHGVIASVGNLDGEVVADTVIGDPQPLHDIADTRDAVQLSGQNVGNLLNAKGITWGWFQGGFADIKASHTGSDGLPKIDYIPHHEPFQYYSQTANPNHLPPSSITKIGRTDQANHQYDLINFWDALQADRLPSVSFLKAPGYQDAHAGYSNPLLEQQYLVETINRLQQSPEWREMAIIIAYDDSDGWYDHVMLPIVSQSDTDQDALTGTDCGHPKAGQFEGRCGHGPRQPLLIVSPFAKTNFVDHSVTDLSSILRFIEDNWQLGRIGNQSFDAQAGSFTSMFDFDHPRFHKLILDSATGEPIRGENGD